jgi:hypothetical protein
MSINSRKRFKSKSIKGKVNIKKQVLKPIKAIEKIKLISKEDTKAEEENELTVHEKRAERSLSPVAQQLGLKDEIASHYPTDIHPVTKTIKVLFNTQIVQKKSKLKEKEIRLFINVGQDMLFSQKCIPLNINVIHDIAIDEENKVRSEEMHECPFKIEERKIEPIRKSSTTKFNEDSQSKRNRLSSKNVDENQLTEKP